VDTTPPLAARVVVANRQSLGGQANMTNGAAKKRSSKHFVPVHHAAARIQRAWKVSRWRRIFVDFSEREVGWVGSLAWLQHRNMLYGTELADDQDGRAWEGFRLDAPLDQEVDPWGYERLQHHLHRMWYGRDPEEPEHIHHAEEEAYYAALAARHQEENVVLYEAPAIAWQATGAGGTRLLSAREPQVAAVRASPSRATPAAEHPAASSQRYSVAGSGKAVSLSPRRKVAPMSAEPVKAAGFTWVQPVVPGLPSVVLPSAVAYRSPPQTHRATRTSTPLETVPTAAFGAAMRRAPVTTVWAHA